MSGIESWLDQTSKAPDVDLEDTLGVGTRADASLGRLLIAQARTGQILQRLHDRMVAATRQLSEDKDSMQDAADHGMDLQQEVQVLMQQVEEQGREADEEARRLREEIETLTKQRDDARAGLRATKEFLDAQSRSHEREVARLQDERAAALRATAEERAAVEAAARERVGALRDRDAALTDRGVVSRERDAVMQREPGAPAGLRAPEAVEVVKEVIQDVARELATEVEVVRDVVKEVEVVREVEVVVEKVVCQDREVVIYVDRDPNASPDEPRASAEILKLRELLSQESLRRAQVEEVVETLQAAITETKAWLAAEAATAEVELAAEPIAMLQNEMKQLEDKWAADRRGTAIEIAAGASREAALRMQLDEMRSGAVEVARSQDQSLPRERSRSEAAELPPKKVDKAVCIDAQPANRSVSTNTPPRMVGELQASIDSKEGEGERERPTVKKPVLRRSSSWLAAAEDFDGDLKEMEGDGPRPSANAQPMPGPMASSGAGGREQKAAAREEYAKQAVMQAWRELASAKEDWERLIQEKEGALAEAMVRERQLKKSLDELLQGASWEGDGDGHLDGLSNADGSGKADGLSSGASPTVLPPMTEAPRMCSPKAVKHSAGANMARPVNKYVMTNGATGSFGGLQQANITDGKARFAVTSALAREREATELALASARVTADVRLQKEVGRARAEAQARLAAAESAAAAERQRLDDEIRALRAELEETAQAAREANSRTLLTQRENTSLSRQAAVLVKVFSAGLQQADEALAPAQEQTAAELARLRMADREHAAAANAVWERERAVAALGMGARRAMWARRMESAHSDAASERESAAAALAAADAAQQREKEHEAARLAAEARVKSAEEDAARAIVAADERLASAREEARAAAARADGAERQRQEAESSREAVEKERDGALQQAAWMGDAMAAAEAGREQAIAERDRLAVTLDEAAAMAKRAALEAADAGAAAVRAKADSAVAVRECEAAREAQAAAEAARKQTAAEATEIAANMLKLERSTRARRIAVAWTLELSRRVAENGLKNAAGKYSAEQSARSAAEAAMRISSDMVLQLREQLQSQRAIVPILFALWRRRGDRLCARAAVEAKAVLTLATERLGEAEQQAASLRDRAAQAEHSERVGAQARAELASTCVALRAAQESLADEKRKVITLNAEVVRRRAAERQAESRAAKWEAEAARFKAEREWRVVVEDMLRRDEMLADEVGDVAVQLEAFIAKVHSVIARAQEELSDKPGLASLLERHLRAVHEWVFKRKGLLEAREANFLHCVTSLGLMTAATDQAPAMQPSPKHGFHNRGSTTLNRSIGVKPLPPPLVVGQADGACSAAAPSVASHGSRRKKKGVHRGSSEAPSVIGEGADGGRGLEPSTDGLITSCPAAVQAFRTLRVLGDESPPPPPPLSARQALPALGAPAFPDRSADRGGGHVADRHGEPRGEMRAEFRADLRAPQSKQDSREHRGAVSADDARRRPHGAEVLSPWSPHVGSLSAARDSRSLSPGPAQASPGTEGDGICEFGAIPAGQPAGGAAPAPSAAGRSCACGAGAGGSSACRWKPSFLAPPHPYDNNKLFKIYGGLHATYAAGSATAGAAAGGTASSQPATALTPSPPLSEASGLLPHPLSPSPRAKAAKRAAVGEAAFLARGARMAARQDGNDDLKPTFFPTATAAS